MQKNSALPNDLTQERFITKETRIIDLNVGEFETLISKTFKNNLRQQSDKPLHLPKEFCSPKEFSHSTGIPYSTVVYRCKVGKLKARQEDPNCAWLIFSSEIDRYITEANDNVI